MTDRYTDAQIKSFWSEQAALHKDSPNASWSDRRVIELEIAEMLKHLADGDIVFDIGCANGYSTCRFAAAKAIDVLGVDYTPEMIGYATERLARDRHQLRGQVRFEVGDILALTQPDAAFDKVVVTRVLINLGSWERQRAGLDHALRVLKPGGILMLSEATAQGWERLNAFRREWGLSDIAMPPFNLYLDEERIVEAAQAAADLVEVSHFASTYYVATRVLKPLLAEALGHRVDIADSMAEWNRWCAQLPAYGDYGVQRLFIFRKR